MAQRNAQSPFPNRLPPQDAVQESPLVPRHQAAGARLSEAAAALGGVLTYGDVPAEYTAGAEGALLLDRTRRGLVSVAGADAEDFLHRILANRVKGLAPGAGNHNLLLTGKGKVVQRFDLAFLGAGYLLATEPEQGEALRDALDMYLFTEDVQVEDQSAHYAPLEIVGPRALEIVSSVVDGAPEARGDEHTGAVTSFEGSTVRLVPLDVAGHAGWRLEGEPDAVPALWDALVAAGATPGGLVAYDSLRAEAVTGEFGREITDDVYPQEARLDDAFSLTKGCYIGQEVVAKIDTYGGLNKQLFRLRVSNDDPVAPGTRLVRDLDGEERDLGVVTSWAYSFAADGGVVLGYVKRKHQEPGTEFRLGDTGATATLVAD